MCWSLLSYRHPHDTHAGCDSAAATFPAEWAKREPQLPWRAMGCSEELHKHWLSSTLLQLAGSRNAATNAEAEHQWEPSYQRAWNKINVVILPHIPMQRKKKNRFLRQATSLQLSWLGSIRSTGKPFPNSTEQFRELFLNPNSAANYHKY